MLGQLKYGFVQKFIDKKEAEFYEYGNIKLKELGASLWEGIVTLTPEIVGASALLAGGWVIINPLISDDPITKPLGLFGVIFIIGVSILIFSTKGAV